MCTPRREDTPLCRGRVLVKDAPGGLVDHCMVQEERGVTSMRSLWQSILDQELTLMAQAIALLKECGVVHRNLKQFRVDSVLVQASRPMYQKVLALKDLTWRELHLQQQTP